MQANQTKVIWTVIIATIILLVAGFMTVNSVKNSIPEIPPYPTYDIPTAQEVADLIVIPAVDFPDTRLSLRQALKEDAIDVCDSEFDMDDLLDDTNLDNEYDDDEVELVREYTDDRHYYHINLGLDNSDDTTISVNRVYKIDVDDDYKDKVYVTCEVTSDDGELEAELSYSL